MPTDLTRMPWVIDAADVGGLPRTLIGPLPRRLLQAGAPQTVSQWVALGQATWHAPAAAAGDMVVFTDINGHEVMRLGPATAGGFEDQRKVTDTVKYEGLVLTVLPSGIVHLEIR